MSTSCSMGGHLAFFACTMHLFRQLQRRWIPRGARQCHGGQCAASVRAWQGKLTLCRRHRLSDELRSCRVVVVPIHLADSPWTTGRCLLLCHEPAASRVRCWLTTERHQRRPGPCCRDRAPGSLGRVWETRHKARVRALGISQRRPFCSAGHSAMELHCKTRDQSSASPCVCPRYSAIRASTNEHSFAHTPSGCPALCPTFTAWPSSLSPPGGRSARHAHPLTKQIKQHNTH